MWLGNSPVYHNNQQVAEVMRDCAVGYLIRNLRPNGTVGVCFSDKDLGAIRAWLDANYPGWTRQP